MNKIKETPLVERPREKANLYGVGSLSNSELFALILRSGTKNIGVVQLAQTLINKAGGISKVKNFEYEDLIKISGISNVKALEILAVFEINKRVEKEKIDNTIAFSNPITVYEYFSKLLRDEKQEFFFVLFLNVKNKLISYKALFKGGISSSVVDINIIFKYAFKYYSTKIICLHNHPSGETTPSKEDVLITLKIQKAGKVLGVELLDHIIIGSSGYTSLKEENLM